MPCSLLAFYMALRVSFTGTFLLWHIMKCNKHSCWPGCYFRYCLLKLLLPLLVILLLLLLLLIQVPGRHLLISTSAAEEGVDVPTCSFVVRYNAATSGTQRIQSKGRSRAQVSEFVTLLQDGDVTWGANMGAREVQMHEKSRKEEENMLLFIRAQRAVAAAAAGSVG